MNKLGVHAFVWTAGWTRDDCARAIAKTAEVGFDLIEASTLDLDAIDVPFTRQQLEKAGIGVTFSFGLDNDTDISSDDREKEKRGEARLLKALHLASDLGATHVCGILESAFQKYAKPTTAEGVKRSVEVLQAHNGEPTRKTRLRRARHHHRSLPATTGVETDSPICKTLKCSHSR